MSENNNKVNGLIDSTVDKMRAMADADTIFGQPIELTNNVKAIPVFKVSYGFAAGGSDFVTKNTGNRPNNFGGGGGGGMTVDPVAFLICNGDNVSILNVAAAEGAAGAAGVIPELFDKVVALYKEFKAKKEEKKEAADAEAK